MWLGDMGFDRSITLAGLRAVPLRAAGGVSPKMALGTMPMRPALLLRLEDTSGCYGWGEVWANFPPRANIHKAHILEDVIAPQLKNLTYVDPREVIDTLRAKLSVYFLHIGQQNVFEHILAGLDIALWDLALRSAGLSFVEFTKLAANKANTYATSLNATDLERLIPKHAKMGQKFFKLKIGFEEHGTTHIVKTATDLCPTGARIMVDSNQSWTLDEATTSLQDLEVYEPLFAEEPLRADAALDEWDRLVRATRVPLAAGENIYGEDNFMSMANIGVQYLQPDVAKWGGISGILNLAKRLPKDVVIWPHFMGTAIGQFASLSLSAALGHSSYCEVDVNANSLRTDLCGDILTIQNGAASLPDAPGLVPQPLEHSLQSFTEKF